MYVLYTLQLFFKTNQGERFGTHKSDVYSACVTMMDILVGDKLHIPSYELVCLQYVTNGTVVSYIRICCRLLSFLKP